jgi:hypothetical protein
MDQDDEDEEMEHDGRGGVLRAAAGWRYGFADGLDACFSGARRRYWRINRIAVWRFAM